MITPGSEQVRATIERDGLLADFERIGATVLANACGPCIGQWARPDVHEGDANTIVTSYNRNFPKRNDGFASTLAFVTSPETVVALALAGTVDFDPITDTLTNDDGEQVRSPCRSARSCPAQGFTPGESGFLAPPADGSRRRGRGQPDQRPAAAARAVRRVGRQGLHRPAHAGEGQGQVHHRPHLGGRARGCKYRGHLENISGNLFLGAVNAFTDEAGIGKDQLDGKTKPLPRHRQALPRGRRRLGGHRRRELRRGLVPRARRHGAPVPRRQGRDLPRRFARIHETNLKKQGVLPLTFADPADYDLIERGRPHHHPRPGRPRPRSAGQLRDRQARRHRRRLHLLAHDERRADRLVPRPAARSTSSASSRASDRHLRRRVGGSRSRTEWHHGRWWTRQTIRTLPADHRGVGVQSVRRRRTRRR